MKQSGKSHFWKQDILKLHLNQPYGELEEELDMDFLLDKYYNFPNEAIYVIDCKQGLLEPLSENFFKIIGIDRHNKNDLMLLYDHVDDGNHKALHHWVKTNLVTAFDESQGIQTEKDVFKCLYKTIDDRILMKSTTPLVYDLAGTLRYSLGKLTDMTGLVAFEHFGYQYDGPSKSRYYTLYNEGLSNDCILTKREQEILILIREGFTSAVIGSKLFISSHTVDTHRRNIIEKMETKSAMEAYRKCKNLGWL